jgi:hypothetical protein
MLPFQGEILVVYFLTQGVAVGLTYFWLSAKSVKSNYLIKQFMV